MDMCITRSALLVSEVDAMGGVVDGGDSVDTKASPLHASIEKAQIELRQEYDVREERRRELDFLEKGGNPLEFKYGNAASVSVQSTSMTDHHPKHLVGSEAKGSFALTASPRGDSVESSGRPGGSLLVLEPNSADNLMLFDCENELRKNGNEHTKESGDSAAFGTYKRRNRSRPNRDGTRSICTNLNPSHKRFVIDSDKRNDRNVSPNSNSNRNDNVVVESDVLEAPINMVSGEHNCVGGREQVNNNKAISSQINGLKSRKRDKQRTPNVAQSNSGGGFNRKGLNYDSSCTQISISLEGTNDSKLCTTYKNINFVGNNKEQDLETPSTEANKPFIEKDICVLRLEEKLDGTGCGFENDVNHTSTIGGVDQDDLIASETERKPSNLLCSKLEENASACTPKRPMDSTNVECSDSKVYVRPYTFDTLCNKAHQDSILEEARIIEAKRKRITELSVGTVRLKHRQKSHWDFVLEEIAWLANDFAQERLWKITAAAQICHQVAFSSRLRIEEQNSRWKPKELARTLAKAVMEFWHSVQEQDANKVLELQCPQKEIPHAIRSYAMRFVKHNNSLNVQHCAPEAPLTPEKIYDFGVLDMSWEDHLTEENLFYTIPSGAIEVYRKCIESHVLYEKVGSSMQEEMETSGYNVVTDFGSEENVFEEDKGGQTSSYYLPGAFEGSSMSLKFVQKKRKISPLNSVLVGKKFGNSLNISFHTKRMRTAARPKLLNPFIGGTRAPNKSDASSGDTNSFQDEQINLPNTLEVDSVGGFEKKLPSDSVEVSNKHKKKAKHPGSMHEQRWQLDSDFHNDQMDRSKGRLEGYHLESDESKGLFGPHVMKKPKMMRQSLDNTLENLNLMSIPSSVAPHMSNMSNPNKLIKIVGGRDKRRKPKPIKIPAGQVDSGRPWSQYEDQALVVLVHDMGPNWELVSDALSSSFQFMRIFIKPKECKERHNFLMDRTGGDGTDSAEDSGSSQPYPSTLPGIPKGSARQLFQRLHGPIEEDTLKSHFEKIIKIGKKQHYPRARNYYVEPKQLQPPHSSHNVALSQVSPNNIGGEPILTPLDLCDVSASCADVLPVGCQVPQPSELSISDVAPVLPTYAANSSVLYASNVVPGCTTSIQSSSFIPSASSRYSIARAPSMDEQQRLQQYNNPTFLSRNITQSGSICSEPGGNGSILCGLNTRPDFQGVPMSSSMLNPPSMLSLPPVQGNSMLRPRDPLHKMRPSQNPEQQMQVPRGSIHGVAPFNGLNFSFSTQTMPPVQSYPALRAIPPERSHLLNNSHIQRPINHTDNTQQHQAYAVRFAKERQQQRLLLQQQQLAASNGVVSHVQSQPHFPVSSPQNSPQVQSQDNSPPVSASSPNSHQIPFHGFSQNTQVCGSQLPNQVGRERQPQQFQPASRQHPQQRPQSPAQQLVKLVPPHPPIQKQHQLSSNNRNLGSSVTAGHMKMPLKLANQNNPRAQRLLQHPSKLSLKEGQTEQPSSNNSADVISESPERGLSNHVRSSGFPPLTNFAGAEPGHKVRQGQSTGNLTNVDIDDPPVQQQQQQMQILQ